MRRISRLLLHHAHKDPDVLLRNALTWLWVWAWLRLEGSMPVHHSGRRCGRQAPCEETGAAAAQLTAPHQPWTESGSLCMPKKPYSRRRIACVCKHPRPSWVFMRLAFRSRPRYVHKHTALLGVFCWQFPWFAGACSWQHVKLVAEMFHAGNGVVATHCCLEVMRNRPLLMTSQQPTGLSLVWPTLHMLHIVDKAAACMQACQPPDLDTTCSPHACCIYECSICIMHGACMPCARPKHKRLFVHLLQNFLVVVQIDDHHDDNNRTYSILRKFPRLLSVVNPLEKELVTWQYQAQYKLRGSACFARQGSLAVLDSIGCSSCLTEITVMQAPWIHLITWLERPWVSLTAIGLLLYVCLGTVATFQGCRQPGRSSTLADSRHTARAHGRWTS